jgi:N-acetylmuramoyl-L-alanine amidase
MRRTRLISILQMSILLLLLQGEVAPAATCSAKAPSDIVIAIDVGHVARQPSGGVCGEDGNCGWGETSARGVPEYDFNLKLATRIHDELVREGFRSARLMIPAVVRPVRRTLLDRTDRANAMSADIFLSVHHDGVHDKFLQPWTYEGQTRHYFDRSTGFSLHVSPRNPQYDDSLALARLIADRLMEKGLRFNRIHEPGNPQGAQVPYADATRGIYRRDLLAVLRLTKMPAVLLEGGVIVNREEELQLATPAYQSTIAAAVVKSITEFCRPRTASLVLAAASPAVPTLPAVSTTPPVPTYKVFGVASNDVLKIRSGPDAATDIVKAIPFDGRGIRMVGSCSGQWCPVEYLNAKGWVNRRHLASE